MEIVSLSLTFQLLTLMMASMPMRTNSDSNLIEYRILEELPKNTLIGSVPKDAKLSDKYTIQEMRALTFSFLRQPDVDIHFFKIDNAGRLKTADRIDRDDLCPHQPTCHVYLDVAVGPPKFFQVINLRIDILDINDNKPTFPQKRLLLEISEATVPGTSFGLPSAEDADSDGFAVQRYELVTQTGKFSLTESVSFEDNTDLRLILREWLDREKDDSYRLKIIAYDGGTPKRETGTLVVNVRVMDANDNDPVFRNASYEAWVAEDTRIGKEVIRVMATDLDEGLNGQIMYGFGTKTADSYGNLFGINQTNGAIYLKDHLDYESMSMYHLVVTAKDRGADSHPAQSTVVIHVKDVNDNAPQVTVNTLTPKGNAEISEGSEISTFVAHISAKDHDSGRSGQLSCTLNSNMFWLEHLANANNQYKIVTAAILDREETPQYHLKVTCHDFGRPPKATNKSIIVTVTDENDHAPSFTQQIYTANVPENNNMGIFIVDVFATDEDIGSNCQVKYSIEDLFARELFMIDSQSGIITAKTDFDHEELTEIVFPVVARDQGTPSNSATAKVIVGITDQNDEKPLFTEYNYSFGVYENQGVGTDVGHVSATDRDSGPYQDVEYAIYSPDVSNTFVIDSLTGNIRTVRVLDREETAIYVLTVTASNPGYGDMITSATVTIHIMDENDNKPIIDFPADSNTSVMVSNQVPKRYVVTRIRAHDLDVGNNAKLTYQIIEGNRDRLFDIDTLTGAITTTTSLGDISSKVVPMRVRVVDGGIPLILTSEQNLNIVINKSITYHPQIGSQEEGFSVGGNMIVVIALSAASALVLIILVIALLIIRKQSIDRKKRTYRCRPEAQMMLRNAADGKEVDDSPDIMRSNGYPRGGLGTDPMGNNHSPYGHTRVGTDGRQLKDPRAASDDSGTLRKQMLEKRLYDYAQPTPPSRTDSLEGSIKEAYGWQQPSGLQSPGGYRSPVHVDSVDSQLSQHRIQCAASPVFSNKDPASPSSSTGQRRIGPAVKDRQMVGLVEPGRPDLDAASSCSGDLSNPDSGKGASEEGDGAHCAHVEPVPPMNPINLDYGRFRPLHDHPAAELEESGFDSSSDPKTPDLLEPKHATIRSQGAKSRLADLHVGANYNRQIAPPPPPYLRNIPQNNEGNYASVDSDSGKSTSSRASSRDNKHVTFKPGGFMAPPCGGAETASSPLMEEPQGHYVPYDSQKHGLPDYDEVLLHDESIPSSNV